MRATYRFLGFLIALLIAVQAATIAWAFAGLGKWVEDGNVLDSAAMEAEEELGFVEEWGFFIHGFFNGMVAIPLAALLLLIVSFFVRIKGTTWAALAVFLLVVIQVLLGSLSRWEGIPVLGLLHGLNALILFVGVLHAVRLAKKPAEPTTPEAPQPAAMG